MSHVSGFIDQLAILNPFWLLVVYLGSCTALGLWFTKRVDNDDARADLSDSGNKLLGASATGLFVLIGFTVAILWNVLQDELGAINNEIEVSGKISATSFLLEEEATDRIWADLIDYLDVVSTGDVLHLATGDAPELPSTTALVALLEEVNNPRNYTTENQWIQQTLVNDVALLSGNRASIRSIATRVMPPVLAAVLVIASGVVAIFAGSSMANHRKPYLVVGWVLSLTLALSLAFWLNNPFTGPIRANFAGVADFADHLRDPPDRPTPPKSTN